MKQLTNLQQNKFGIGFEVGNRYAFGNTNVGGQLWPAIYGAPNNWGVSSDGKWTKDWETDQFKAGVQLAHDVFADGSFDPEHHLHHADGRRRLSDAADSLIASQTPSTSITSTRARCRSTAFMTDAESALESAPGAAAARGGGRQGAVQPGHWQLRVDRLEEGRPGAHQTACST